MAVFGAVPVYVLQMVSFIVLSVRFPYLERRYRGRMKIFGAALAPVIAMVTLWTLLHSPDHNEGVIGTAVWFLFGIAYYAVYARHRLVLAPEEEAAIEHRRRDSKPCA